MVDADPMVSERQVHPATAQLLRYFEFAHLPPHLQVVSAPFGELAQYAVHTLQLEGPELTAGLRRLLEGKDSVVRAALDVEPPDLMARAVSGVPEQLMAPVVPVVQRMQQNMDTRTLTVGVSCPATMSPEQVADAVRDEVLERLERLMAEQSARMPSAAESIARHVTPRPISDSPQA